MFTGMRVSPAGVPFSLTPLSREVEVKRGGARMVCSKGKLKRGGKERRNIGEKREREYNGGRI